MNKPLRKLITKKMRIKPIHYKKDIWQKLFPNIDPMELRIAVLGDVHGFWSWLNKFIQEKQPHAILQTGDFGYFPKNPHCHPHHIKNGETVIFWLDGNHEDFGTLKEKKQNEIRPRIFYMPRGSTLELPDGRVILFIGGADSVDKLTSIPGVDWFPDELLTQKDLNELPPANTKIDIILSHTCPEEFNVVTIYFDAPSDPSRKVLSTVLHTYKPKLWYFGHWHQYRKGDYRGCRWTALNKNPELGWWEWLSP